MNIDRTPDGIPVVTLTDDDLDGNGQAGFFAALDQVVANANARLFPTPTDEERAASIAEDGEPVAGLYEVFDRDLAPHERRVFRHSGHGHWHEVGGGYISPEALRQYRLVLLVHAKDGDL